MPWAGEPAQIKDTTPPHGLSIYFQRRVGRMFGIVLSALSAALSLTVIGLIIWRWKE